MGIKQYKKKMLKDAINIDKEILGKEDKRIGGYIRKLGLYIKYFVKIYVMNKVVLPYFEIVITTKCSLQCKDCGSIIPYYANPYNIDLPEIEKDLKNLFEFIDEVRLFGVIGGETFLYPELDKVLNNLCSRKQVGSIRVFTNAVVKKTLSDTLVAQLKHPKVHISISNYGLPSTYTFYNYLKSEKFDVRMGPKMEWLDRGDMTCRNRDKEELKRQFIACYMKTCKSILNGRFYYCPRSGHAHDLGLVETPQNDYVILSGDKESVRNKILYLYYGKDYLAACNFCDVGTEKCVPIPAASQLTPEQKNEIVKRSMK